MDDEQVIDQQLAMLEQRVADRKAARRQLGVPCPACVQRSRRKAAFLLPGQICGVHGYVDPRPKFKVATGKGRRST